MNKISKSLKNYVFTIKTFLLVQEYEANFKTFINSNSNLKLNKNY